MIVQELDQESEIRDPDPGLLLITGVLKQPIPFSCPFATHCPNLYNVGIGLEQSFSALVVIRVNLRCLK